MNHPARADHEHDRAWESATQQARRDKRRGAAVRNLLKRLLGRAPSPRPKAASHQPAHTAAKRVWRIGPDSPGGGWVDPSAPPATVPGNYHPEAPPSGWLTSSMDLLDGVQVVEDTDGTHDALFDESTEQLYRPPST